MPEPFSCLKVTEYEPGILLLSLDMPDRGANILNQTLFSEIDRAMEELGQRQDLDGLILYSAKPNIFVAGADLAAIEANLDWPDKEIIKFCEKGRAVMARFSRCPFVTVAAIQGACVGGGLELALWCDYRIASDDRRTLLGLPEVKLGLVPGWAGTARLPRIIGFEPAAELLVSGRNVSAVEAKSLGFVNEVVATAELLPAAVRRIRQSKRDFILDRKQIMGPVSRLNATTRLSHPLPPAATATVPSEDIVENNIPLAPELDEPIKRLGQYILSNAEIYPFAPTVLLEHLVRTASASQTEAWKSESLAMAQVWGSPANRGLLNYFFLGDRNKKQPGLVDLKLKPAPIKTIGIVGAGLMGGSIAEICVGRGLNVLLFDIQPELAIAVCQRIQQKPSNAKTSGSLNSVTSLAELKSAELVIESIVENESAKKSLFAELEQVVFETTLLATNTSALPVSRLANELKHPERFCGIHFCHPELMALVEVACGERTSEQTVAASVGFVRQLGKTPIAMNDGPGFVVNRLLAAMIKRSIELLMDGMSIEEIDMAMRDFGFLGGPFEIIDTIGIDTCVYAGRTMWDAGLTCVSDSPLLPKMMKLNRLGRKTGSGFYRYSSSDESLSQMGSDSLQRESEKTTILTSPPKGQPPLGIDAKTQRGETDSVASNIVSGYQKQTKERLKSEEASRQIVMAMLIEGIKILEEELVDDFRDIDLCIIQGLSFPKHRGGLFFWGDMTGLSTKLSRNQQNFYQ